MNSGQAILVLNAGSSSLKFALYRIDGGLEVTARGEVEDLDSAPHFIARDPSGAVIAETHGDCEGLRRDVGCYA